MQRKNPAPETRLATPSSLRSGENSLDLAFVVGAHHAPDLAALVHQHQRGPELHAERSAERLSLAVLDLEMTDFGMTCEHGADVRLRGFTESAPAGAELQHRGLDE